MSYLTNMSSHTSIFVGQGRGGALGPCCCTRAFSSCEQGLLCSGARASHCGGLLYTELWLQARAPRLGHSVYLPCGTWHLPRPLASRFLTTLQRSRHTSILGHNCIRCPVCRVLSQHCIYP